LNEVENPYGTESAEEVKFVPPGQDGGDETRGEEPRDKSFPCHFSRSAGPSPHGMTKVPPLGSSPASRKPAVGCKTNRPTLLDSCLKCTPSQHHETLGYMGHFWVCFFSQL